MPTSSTSRPSYDTKKQRALEAAAQVFARKGYHGATTQNIAEELGIKQGSLYYYFKSKQQALQEVCEFGLRNYVDQMRAIRGENQSIKKTLSAMVAAHLANYRGENSAMKVHNDQRLYLPKARRIQIKKLGSSYRELLEDTIRDGIRVGQLREEIDAHFTAYSIIGLCNAWGANLMRDQQLSLEETVQRTIDLILCGIES